MKQETRKDILNYLLVFKIIRVTDILGLPVSNETTIARKVRRKVKTTKETTTTEQRDTKIS